MMAQTAMADVTPGEVWAEFKAYMEGYGYTVSATENDAGDTLTVSDITMTVPIPEEEGSMTMTMEELVFAADGGAVDVSWPAEMPVDLSIEAEGETVEIGLLYKSQGHEMTVSGDADMTQWDLSATSIALELDGVTIEGEALGPEMARGELVLDGVDSATSMASADEMRNVEQTMTVDALSYDIAAQDPENPENTLLMKGGMTDVTYSGDGSLPMEFDSEDPAEIFQNGFTIKGTFGFSGGESQFNFVDGSETLSYQSSSDGGDGALTMDATTWGYDYLLRNLDLQVAGAEIPFPVSLKAAEFGGELLMPVGKTDAPQDVALGLNLTDFEMNDMIWQMFDPGAELPRDPATIKLDLSGKAKMLFDLFDPEQADMMAGADMPAEIYELTLNNLMVKAVGAMLTGTGGFTFDNSDLETFGGMPKPTGEVNAELTGANALLDKLIAMGLLPEEEAAGFRMMMSMFAVPAGDDVLTSKIEINEQGHVLANGQRIQ